MESDPTTSPSARPDLAWARAFGGQLTTRAIQLAAFAPDASHILRRPKAVLIARGRDDVAAAMRLAEEVGEEITFRSGGTSLSGQAGSQGVLVDTRRNFRQVEVLDQGARVRCGPGVTLDIVNAYLAPFGRRLGPDPASSRAATIGGVVANNASGMSAGTTANSYCTLESAEVVLASGTVVHTGAPDAAKRLQEAEPEIHAGLLDLRDRIRANPESRRIIAEQYSMKNTMGYSINSFVDFDDPVDILAHLMVGSEGTLAFLSEATLTTVPVEPFAATALLIFDTLALATEALEPLRAAGASTLELLDTASIRAVQPYVGADDPLQRLIGDQVTVLLVELRAATEADLETALEAVTTVTDTLALAEPAKFSQDPDIRAGLWEAREGLYTIVAGARPPGSTALLEDVAVPVPRLSEACAKLRLLFEKHGFNDGVIFGHAKDGNIHFMLTLRTDNADDLVRFDAFNEEMVDLVLACGGTLKAEHGTGRIMAPFVRRQFGAELYEVMCQIKELLDPGGVLNPGTIVNDDPQAHMKSLKVTPLVNEFFDRCVTCGFCEPVCPSRDLTLTPRQRLQVLRRLKELPSDSPVAREILRDWDYWAVETCAADSLCDTNCPVDIDTGVLMKRFRAARHGTVTQRMGLELAKHWSETMRGARGMLTLLGPVPRTVLDTASRAGRLVLPRDLLPRAGDDLPGVGRARVGSETIGAVVE